MTDLYRTVPLYTASCLIFRKLNNTAPFNCCAHSFEVPFEFQSLTVIKFICLFVHPLNAVWKEIVS
jgi:hypothetical protein